MTDKTSKVVLQYSVDKGSLAQVDRSVSQVESRLNALSKATSDTGAAARQAAQSLREAFKDPGDKPIKRLLEERKALAETTAARKKLNDARQKGGGGAITESIGQGSTALGGLASVVGRSGALGGGLGAAGDILGAVEGVSKLKGELKGLTEGLASAGGLTGKLAGTIGGAGTLGIAAVAGAAAVGILAVGIDNFNKTIAPAANALAQAQTRLESYYDAIEQGTTTTITKQIELLKSQKAAADAEAKDIQAAIDQAAKRAEKGGLEAVAVKFLGLSGDFQKLTARLDELKKQASDADGKMQGLTAALGDSAVKARDAAEYEAKLAAARADAITKGIAEETALAKLARSGTRKQVQDEITDLQDQAAALANAYSKALESNDAASQELAKKLKAQYDDVINKIGNREALLPVIAARDAENKLLQRTQELLDGVNRSRLANEDDSDPLAGRRGKESTAAERAANAVITNENKKNAALIDIVEKYDADVQKIEADSARERADLAQRYTDQLVGIAREAADAASANLRELQQAREDAAREFGRDDQKAEREAARQALDIRINAARDEERAARDHYKRMDQIRRDAQDREFDLILNRDFIGLAQSRRQTGRQLEDESGGFIDQQNERRIAAQEQLADLQRQIASERTERLIDYQNRLADARIAFDRENAQIEANRVQQLALAQQQYQRDLAAAAQKAAQELAIRQQAAQNEIRLVNMTEAQKQKAYEQSLAHTRAVSSQMAAAQNAEYQRQIAALNNMSASQRNSMARQLVTRRAGGGSLAAGQMSLVNDGYPGQRESFNGVPFPPGLGLFTPMQSGTVNPGNRSMSNNWNISGASNPEAVWRAIEPRLERLLAEVFD